MWGNDELAFAVSWWWKTRNLRVWHVQPAHRDVEPRVVEERSFQDRYGDPGNPVTVRNKWGRRVMLAVDGGKTPQLHVPDWELTLDNRDVN